MTPEHEMVVLAGVWLAMALLLDRVL